MAKEIEELSGLAGARAEMHVGDEQRANMSRRFGYFHDAKSTRRRLVCLRPDRYASLISIM
jgi:hypothetical protein